MWPLEKASGLARSCEARTIAWHTLAKPHPPPPHLNPTVACTSWELGALSNPQGALNAETMHLIPWDLIATGAYPFVVPI